MSCTIFGNRTQNGIEINDMVDNHNDIIYPLSDRFFARLVCADIDDDQKLAIAAFDYDDPFNAIFAVILSEPFDAYVDENSEKELLQEELKTFAVKFNEFQKK